jgi:hypothetical protein
MSRYPELPIEELSRAVEEFIGDEDFLISLISNIDAPSRVELALKRIKLQRFSHGRKTREGEKLEFLENFVNIKNSIQNQELPSGVWQSTLPVSGTTEQYQINESSLFLDGFTDPTVMSELTTRRIEISTVGNIKQNLDENIMVIKESTHKGTPLSLYAIKDVIQARNYYSGDPVMVKELLDILKEDVANRNRRTGLNVIQNEEDFLREVPIEVSNTGKPKANSRLATIDKYIRGIILDELELASQNLTDEFFQNKISFEEYMGKKTRLYEDGNKFWP